MLHGRECASIQGDAPCSIESQIRAMTKRQRNTYFQCQQFRIEQQGAAMKVTTDTCTLGAWVPVEGAQRVLDIGTGSGLLALFAAQRAPRAQVDAIELDAEAAAQAKANFESSPFASRLKLIEGDILTFEPSEGYDAILCNPPFFSESTPNNCERLRQARHDNTLSLTALLDALQRLLLSEGSAYLLLPTDCAAQLLPGLDQHGLHLRRRLQLISQPGDTPHRWILGLSKTPGGVIEESLTLYTEHPVHSREAGRLFYPYYTRLRCEADDYVR
ncbi:methyltransferase [Marinobacterium sp. D7]|uniref:tRNA1(Val) (adenine(37)-N6)-methyltransferase n=1 Tax=Marinobacterium ramblicola TaxID=2849041 RepID=UPI001C2D218A|nr:methyltransferase [Marinobacterium ramblicola]MBV1788573.1 methyltransferase [Marinobacterium ramblicola]